MRKLLSAVLVASLAGAAPANASRTLPLWNAQAAQPGFLPAASCTGKFVLSNYVPNANDFVPADGFWSAGNSASSVPTVSNITDTLRDGTSGTVSEAVIGATTSGTTQYSAIFYNDTHDFAQYPMAFSFYAKVISGTGSVYGMLVGGATFVSVSISTDGAWHKITVPWVGGGGVNNMRLEFGIDQRDPTQVRTANPAMTIELAGAYFNGSANASLVAYSDVKTGGDLAVTSSPPLQAQVTKPCPPRVAQRDISTWNVVANPAIQGNPANIYEAGGLASGNISAQFQSGGKYWGFAAECFGVQGNIQYFGSCLLSSTDGIHYTEDTSGNNPQLVPYGAKYAYPNIGASGGGGFTANATGTATYTGSGCATPPVISVSTNSSGVISSADITGTAPLGVGNCYPAWPGSGNIAWSYSGVGSGSGASFVFNNFVGTQSSGGGPVRWTLHPSFYPYGCSDGTNPHNFCVIYSGVDSSNASHLYTAWSDTVNGVYTPLGCTGPGPCGTATPLTFTNLPVAGVYINPATPQVINVGGINGTNYIYVYAGGNFDSGATIAIFATDANPAHTGSGTTLAFAQNAGLTNVTGLDWYAPVVGTTFLDLTVFLDHCNMYELYYVVESTHQQEPPWFVSAFSQIMGGAVSNSALGPWYQQNSPVLLPFTGNPDGNTGDPVALELGGNFELLSTYNTPGGGPSAGGSFALSGPQGSCP